MITNPGGVDRCREWCS